MSNQNKQQRTFSADILGMQIKIFRTGRFLRVPTGRNSTDPRQIKSIHSHFTYEIFFVTGGSLKLITERNTMTFERRVIIISPRIKHYSTPDGGDTFCLLFTVEKPKNGRQPNTFQKLLQEADGDGIVCDFPITDDIAFYVRKLSEKCDESNDASEKETELLMSLIFHEIVHILSPNGKAVMPPITESTHISEIEGFINANCLRKLTLSDVADHIFLSTRQVSRIIHKEYGCTLAEFVLEKRLAVAEMMLKNTNMKISDIAKQASIGSENYFYVLFKKHYGISPLKFRKKHRND